MLRNLDDPVDGLLPELAGRRVLARLDGSISDTVPARRSITVRRFTSQRKAPPPMLNQHADILLVEDNPNDIELTLHAFKTANLANTVHVARDGVEALDFLFCTGPHADRSIHVFDGRVVEEQTEMAVTE